MEYPDWKVEAAFGIAFNFTSFVSTKVSAFDDEDPAR
jgi:hypothetical protein